MITHDVLREKIQATGGDLHLDKTVHVVNGAGTGAQDLVREFYSKKLFGAFIRVTLE
jgi:hypothetical protein